MWPWRPFDPHNMVAAHVPVPRWVNDDLVNLARCSNIPCGELLLAKPEVFDFKLPQNFQ